MKTKITLLVAAIAILELAGLILFEHHCDIASFCVTWAQADLPPATYSATITTTYTAP